MKGRNQYFDFNRRLSRFDNDWLNWGYKVNGEVGMQVAWDEELVSADGAHYHCWIPTNLDPDQVVEFYTKFKIAAKRKGDPVSFSWDFMPTEDQQNGN